MAFLDDKLTVDILDTQEITCKRYWSVTVYPNLDRAEDRFHVSPIYVSPSGAGTFFKVGGTSARQKNYGKFLYSAKHLQSSAKLQV